jgi:hypothetical protein
MKISKKLTLIAFASIAAVSTLMATQSVSARIPGMGYWTDTQYFDANGVRVGGRRDERGCGLMLQYWGTMTSDYVTRQYACTNTER